MPTKTVRNVLGEPLATCSLNPLAGFLRDGVCRMPTGDAGRHGVCARITEAFLAFTKQQGNDLSTPRPLYGFPGLKPGDRWCLCVDRWKEAEASGVAPPVILAATHASAGKHIPIERLKQCALAEEDTG